MQEKEYSYIELLMRIKEDVNEDIIPKSEKEEIMRLIERLQFKLWKYSY